MKQNSSTTHNRSKDVGDSLVLGDTLNVSRIKELIKGFEQMIPAQEDSLLQKKHAMLELLGTLQRIVKNTLTDLHKLHQKWSSNPQRIQYLFGNLSQPKPIKEKKYDVTNENKRLCCKIKCIYDFICWLSDQVQNGRNDSEYPNHLFAYFIDDFFNDADVQGHISGCNCVHIAKRCQNEHSRFLFEDAKRLCYYGHTHSATTSEIFGIMGLRQAIEAKFNRLIGLSDIGPKAKFSHSFVVGIFLSHWHENWFTNKDVTEEFLRNINTIVDWANRIVHWNISSPVWLLWKAFAYVEPLFRELPAQMRNNSALMAILTAPGTKRLNSTIKMTEAELTELRNSFISELINDYPNAQYVQWERPEATIPDHQGPWDVRVDVQQWKGTHHAVKS